MKDHFHSGRTLRATCIMWAPNLNYARHYAKWSRGEPSLFLDSFHLSVEQFVRISISQLLAQRPRQFFLRMVLFWLLSRNWYDIFSVPFFCFWLSLTDPRTSAPKVNNIIVLSLPPFFNRVPNFQPNIFLERGSEHDGDWSETSVLSEKCQSTETEKNKNKF